MPSFLAWLAIHTHCFRGQEAQTLYLEDITLHSPLLQNQAPRRTPGLGGNHSSWLVCVCKAASAKGQCSEILWAPREGNIQGLLTWERLPFSQWFPSHSGFWL